MFLEEKVVEVKPYGSQTASCRLKVIVPKLDHTSIDASLNDYATHAF